MKQYSLNAQSRDIVGRKVKNLRHAGLIPATVYGKKISSQSIGVAVSDFVKIYAQTGESGLIELTVAGKTNPVLIHHVQVHAVSGEPLHVEFYHVDLKEKVHTKVPLVIVGEAPVVVEKKGVLLTLLSEVEVEALPTDLPERIHVDVSGLTEVNAEIKVKDLVVPAGVVILTDAAVGVVKVSELVSKEAQEQAAQEAAAATAESAEGAADGETGSPEKAEDKPATDGADKPSEVKKE